MTSRMVWIVAINSVCAWLTGHPLQLAPAAVKADGTGEALAAAQAVAREHGVACAEAVRIAASRSGITGEPTVERISTERRPWWLRMLLSERAALIWAALLAGGALAGCLAIHWQLAAYAAAYLVQNILYSVKLKEIAAKAKGEKKPFRRRPKPYSED